MTAIYLAGPDVFRPDAEAHGETLKALCAEFGLSLIHICPADAAEVRVERRQVAVVLVPVAPAGVGLPHLHQGVRDRLAVLVEDPAEHDDALALGQAAVVEVEQQVVVVAAEPEVGEVRPAGFRERLRDAHQRLARRARHGGCLLYTSGSAPPPGRQGCG